MTSAAGSASLVSASRAVRVARGGFVALSSVLIAALSHVAGGGASPGALGVVLGLAFALLASTALAGRRLSALRLSVAVCLSQFVFHVLFSLGAELPEQTPVSASTRAGGAGGNADAMLGMVMSGGHHTSLPTFSGVSGASTAALESASMWAGHAVAAAVTIGLLLHGGRAFATLVRLARERLVFVITKAGEVVESVGGMRHFVSRVVADRSGVPTLEVLLVTRPRRGPPVVARRPDLLFPFSATRHPSRERS